MKRSELKSQIKNEIIDILEAVSQDDVKAQQDYNAELAKTAELEKSMAEGNDSDKSQDDGYVNHTYDDSVIDKYNVPVEPTAVFEEDDEDKEPTKSQLKNEPISKIGYKLADTQKEMKQVVKKWKDAEGAEKEKLKDRLRELTKIKKELESLLENKK
jgi:hypothetical protein|tara:strand:- start:472 stop:942 length:471 start_codon:yes stop_codon:yes gene_type:complete